MFSDSLEDQITAFAEDTSNRVSLETRTQLGRTAAAGAEPLWSHLRLDLKARR